MHPEVDPLVGTTVRFSTTDYPFDRIFLDVANRHLGGGLTIPSLDRLHEAVSPIELASLYTAFYQGMRGEPFGSLYAACIERVIAPLFQSPIRYQRVPGIRVHLPEAHTVMYHTDEWYGHGENIVNFWLPLTRSFGTNALYVAPLDVSMREVRRLEAARATIEDINTRLSSLSAPVELDFGQTYIFCARVVHGTERNLTGRTRVSLDFRLMLDGERAGAKPPDEYYARPGTPPVTAPGQATTTSARTAISYLLPKHGFTRYVSASNQRLVVSECARSRGLTIMAEETEIRTMAHHPTLLALVRGIDVYAFDTIVAYSVFCLPEEPCARQLILRTAREHGRQILFANENLSFPHEHAEQEIEYQRGL